MGYGPACVSRELLWTRGIIRIRTRTARGGFYEVALRGEIFGSESTKHVDDDKLDSKLNGGYLPTSEDRSATFVSRKRSCLSLLLTDLDLHLGLVSAPQSPQNPSDIYPIFLSSGLNSYLMFLLTPATSNGYSLLDPSTAYSNRQAHLASFIDQISSIAPPLLYKTASNNQSSE
ncbi:hypothetical protein MMC31_003307 [Peltigera leucophlebia]|nr:hypothetical protein [Peltigera leucophlebia]